MEAVIVVGSGLFAVTFALAWLLRPSFRAWLEQPKHTFAKNARRYDSAAMAQHAEETGIGRVLGPDAKGGGDV